MAALPRPPSLRHPPQPPSLRHPPSAIPLSSPGSQDSASLASTPKLVTPTEKRTNSENRLFRQALVRGQRGPPCSLKYTLVWLRPPFYVLGEIQGLSGDFCKLQGNLHSPVPSGLDFLPSLNFHSLLSILRRLLHPTLSSPKSSHSYQRCTLAEL